ncbi:MAG: PHP domain-containing protein [Candidatus Woesearchaeota archaeon]|nr:PHP domain-containing protein [Candidatus Woesearchaeota archaeon]
MNAHFGMPDVVALTKQYMVVDMHFHSKHSHDSSTRIKDIIRKCRELGVFVALTDHNSINGVLEAQELAPGVIKPGVEITTRDGKDLLCYFYSYKELEYFFNAVVQPHIKKKNSLRSGKSGIRMTHLLDELKDYNVVTAAAHPFGVGPRRSYPWFKKRPDVLKQVTAVEVVNQAILHKQNLAALGWAMQHDKAIVGGSDGHVLQMLGSAFTYSKATSWENFLDNIKKHKNEVVGEERKLHQHAVNMGRILKEKAKVIQNHKR